MPTFDASASRRRDIAKFVAGLVVFAIVASALALVFGSRSEEPGPESQQSIGGDPSETATGTGTAPTDSSFVIPMTPAPGWQAETTASGRTDNGDVLVQMEAVGPESQLRLMWYVAAGSCHLARDEQLRYLYPLEVLFRANSDSSELGYRAVTLLLERDWITRPLMVGAYQLDGEGSLLACGDVPPSETSPVPLNIAAGWEVEAQAKGWIVQNGDALIQVEAHGPEDELDLIWYVAAGRCDVDDDEHPSETLRQISPSKPGPHTLTLVLEREWLTQPLIVGAVQRDGGAPVACGDVPAFNPPEDTSSAEPTPPGEQNWSPYR